METLGKETCGHEDAVLQPEDGQTILPLSLENKTIPQKELDSKLSSSSKDNNCSRSSGSNNQDGSNSWRGNSS